MTIVIDNFIDEGPFSADGSSIGDPTVDSHKAKGYLAILGDGPQSGGVMLGGYRSQYLSNLDRDADGQIVNVGNTMNSSALPPVLIFNDSNNPGTIGLKSCMTFVWDGVNHTIPSPYVTTWNSGYQAVDSTGFAAEDFTAAGSTVTLTLSLPYTGEFDPPALADKYGLDPTVYELSLYSGSTVETTTVTSDGTDATIVFNLSDFPATASAVTAVKLVINPDSGVPGWRVALNSIEVTAGSTPPCTCVINYLYDMRGYDTGAGGFVYWTSTGTPDVMPVTTTPAATGEITGVVIVGFRPA